MNILLVNREHSRAHQTVIHIDPSAHVDFEISHSHHDILSTLSNPSPKNKKRPLGIRFFYRHT